MMSSPRNDHGQILIITAISLTAVLGIAALSIDATYFYAKRNFLYGAADAAAKSAAFAKRRDPTADLRAFATHELTALGLTPVVSCGSTGGTSLCVSSPPTTGAYAGNPDYVEAIVSQVSLPTFFGKALGWTSASPGARAVAGISNPANCVTFNGDLSIGNFAFTLDCGLSVGGTLTGTNPQARVQDSAGNTNTIPVNVVRTCSGYCGKMGDLHQHAPAPYDVFAAKLTPPTAPKPSSCGPGLTPTIGPGCYTNISPIVSRLLPGDYYITGTVNIDNLSADDVFLYLIGLGRFNIVGENKRFHITAHTASGPYQGIAIWQDASDTQPFLCLGCPPSGTPYPPNNFTLDFTGAIYMPGVDQQFRNSLSISPSSCALFIAHSLTVTNGSGTMTNIGCGGLYGSGAGAIFLSTGVAE